MSTNDYYSLSKQNSVNKLVINQNGNNQYSNINLNLNQNCENDVTIVKSQSKFTKNTGKDYVLLKNLNDNVLIKNFWTAALNKFKDSVDSKNDLTKTSSNSSKKNDISETFQSLNPYNSENDKKEQKKWKKKNSGSANNSTLSLHIKAYENAFKTSEVDNAMKKRKSINKSVFTMSNFAIQNPFEFPRQQESGANDPEVSQFQASQKLLNPDKRTPGRQEKLNRLLAVVEPLAESFGRGEITKKQFIQRLNAQHAQLGYQPEYVYRGWGLYLENVQKRFQDNGNSFACENDQRIAMLQRKFDPNYCIPGTKSFSRKNASATSNRERSVARLYTPAINALHQPLIEFRGPDEPEDESLPNVREVHIDTTHPDDNIVVAEVLTGNEDHDAMGTANNKNDETMHFDDDTVYEEGDVAQAQIDRRKYDTLTGPSRAAIKRKASDGKETDFVFPQRSASAYHIPQHFEFGDTGAEQSGNSDQSQLQPPRRRPPRLSNFVDEMPRSILGMYVANYDPLADMFKNMPPRPPHQVYAEYNQKNEIPKQPTRLQPVRASKTRNRSSRQVQAEEEQHIQNAAGIRREIIEKRNPAFEIPYKQVQEEANDATVAASDAEQHDQQPPPPSDSENLQQSPPSASKNRQQKTPVANQRPRRQPTAPSQKQPRRVQTRRVRSQSQPRKQRDIARPSHVEQRTSEIPQQAHQQPAAEQQTQQQTVETHHVQQPIVSSRSIPQQPRIQQQQQQQLRPQSAVEQPPQQHQQQPPAAEAFNQFQQRFDPNNPVGQQFIQQIAYAIANVPREEQPAAVAQPPQFQHPVADPTTPAVVVGSQQSAQNCGGVAPNHNPTAVTQFFRYCEGVLEQQRQTNDNILAKNWEVARGTLHEIGEVMKSIINNNNDNNNI